jgi:hypothetical protein
MEIEMAVESEQRNFGEVPQKSIDVLAVQKQLIQRITSFMNYRPMHDFDSACDHNIPFHELTEEQFLSAADIARHELMGLGRYKDARDVELTYKLKPIVYH